MRRIATICGLVAAFMCLVQNANAQYLPDRIHRDGDRFVDDRHRVLSDNELIDAVGIDIFEETVVGARKQYNAGRKLVISGAIGAGAGMTGLLTGVVMLAASMATDSSGRTYVAEEELGFAGGMLTILGGTALGLGATALSAGIPLKVIGQSRLNWVENDYNERQNYTLHVGAAPHGVGFTLNF